jgi:hydroxyethylthiazole kinase
MTEKLWQLRQKVKEKSPLVHNITNYVVMNTTANALLAIGASPVMAHAEDEVQDMVQIANSLVINIGTLSSKWVNAMKLALKKANQFNKPVVLDPVGAGATPYRNKVVAELLANGIFSVIRGNASEIMALASTQIKTRGVDTTESSSNAESAAKSLNKKYGCVVCISGATDYIINENKLVKINNGHPLMSKVTGMGCTATALIGAFIGTGEDIFDSVVAATAVMAIAGELAFLFSQGPGSLQMNFLDKLYNMTKEEFFHTIKLQY